MNDAWIGVVGTLLGAVLGGLGGFVSAWLPKYREDCQRRQVLATVLLSEICALEQMLRRYVSGERDRLVFGPHQTSLYDHAGPNRAQVRVRGLGQTEQSLKASVDPGEPEVHEMVETVRTPTPPDPCEALLDEPCTGTFTHPRSQR